MDTDMNTDENNMEQKTTCRIKRRRRKSKKINPALCEDMEICDQGAEKTFGDISILENMEISKSKMQDNCDVEITVQCPTWEHMDTTGNQVEKITEKKKKKRKKSKAHQKDNLQSDQGAEKTTLGEILILEKMEISKSEVQDTRDVEVTVQCPIQEHMDTTGNLVEKSTEKKKKKKKRRRKPKAHHKDNLQSDQGAEKATLSENLILEKMEISKTEMQDTHDVKVTVQCAIQKHMDTTGNQVEKSTEKKKKRRTKPKTHQKDNLESMYQTEVVACLTHSDTPRDAGRNAGLENIEATSQERGLSAKENFRPSDINAERFKCDPVAVIEIANNFLKVSRPSPERVPVVRLRGKLLILDVNGLLADVVSPPPKEHKADVNISRRAIFMRPFCSDFLRFCFERFDVGIWSSRSMKILDPMIDYLLGDLKQKLLFFWDTSQCTATRFKTLENKHKPLVFKDLRKIWEKSDPKLPWEKGDYNESNTLLLDDSPYKALLNPVHTGVFPFSYTFKDSSDNSLGPGGDLRVYLEHLANADNWKEFVEKHPFGQRGIDESSLCWAFYSKVLSSRSNL